MRKIPKDFIPEKSCLDLSKQELEQRFSNWNALDMRSEQEGNGRTPSEDWGLDKFATKLESVRSLISDLALPIMNQYFSTKFQERYPSITLVDGRKLNCVKDFIDFLESFESRNDSDLRLIREITSFVIYGIWGKSHIWAIHGEKAIMNWLGLAYVNTLSDGTKRKREQRGGCIKYLLVKERTQAGDEVRKTFEKTFYERFYTRDLFTPALHKLKHMKLVSEDATFVTYPESFDKLDLDDMDPSEIERVRVLFRSASDARFLVRATVSSHGCNGLLYYNEYHPGRIDILKKMAAAPVGMSAKPVVEKETEDELLEWAMTQIKSGKIKTKRDFASVANGQISHFQNGKRIKLVQLPSASTAAHSVSDLSRFRSEESDIEIDPQAAAEEFAKPMEVKIPFLLAFIVSKVNIL